MKKKLEELDIDELEKLIKSDNFKEEKIEYKNDVPDFIQYYNLKPGKHKVQSGQLYSLYKQWSENPIKQRFFNQEFGIFFERKHSDQVKYFLLNSDSVYFYKLLNRFKKKEVHKTSSKKWSEHFNAFKDYLQIKPGTFWVPSSVLYSTYNTWLFNNRSKKKLGPIQFNKFLKLYFEYKIIYSKQWFGVDHSFKNHLTDELIEIMKNKGNSPNAPKEE